MRVLVNDVELKYKYMAIWGVDNGTVDEERLKPLGLICYGGGTNKKGTTYHVHNKDKSFNVEVNQKDFNNIDKIYRKFKNKNRKEKLEKINRLNE